MKIKSEVNLNILLNYGFVKTTESDDYDNLNFLDLKEYTWLYEIGHSRRGQYYYLLINLKRELNIVASEPDGSGGTIELPSIIKQMILDRIVE